MIMIKKLTVVAALLTMMGLLAPSVMAMQICPDGEHLDEAGSCVPDSAE